MKTTTVPAQVTTVEDRIAGSLNFTQLFILALPIFITGGMYIALPPFVKMPTYKIVIATTVLVVSLTLAIRIKGKLLIQWLLIIGRYNLRPRYFVYNKNANYLRSGTSQQTKQITVSKQPKKVLKPKLLPNLNIAKRVQLETVISDPRARAHFEINKHGGLHVRITEVKQES